MTATPGTIPALTPYQPGTLPIASTVAVEIVDTLNATAAVSYSMLITDLVGKVPSVMTNANPANGDLIAFYQVSSGLSFASPIGNLAVAFGNVPVGGTQGQLLVKDSATNFDASWNNLSAYVTAGTSIAVSGSTTITIALATVATALMPGPFQTTSLTTNGVLFGNGSTAISATSAGNVGLPLLGNGTSSAPSFAVLGLVGGGLNTTTLTNNGLVYGNGTSTVGITDAGSVGLPLVGNGSSVAPAFAILGLSGGGINTTFLTNNGVLYGAGTSTVGITPVGGTSLPLVSSGGASAPSFSALTVAGGGTGTTALASFGALYANGTTALGVTLAGGTALPLVSNGTNVAPSFSVLTVPGGGSGTASLPAFAVVVANGSSPLSVVPAPIFAGLVLTSNGTSIAPSWESAGAGTVIGPGSSTTNDIVIFSDTGGVNVSDSGFSIKNSGPTYGQGYVNLVRNGTLDTWARGTTVTIGTGGAYGPDGFIITPTGATTTVTRTTGRQPTLYSVKIAGTTSLTNLSIKQRIESDISARCASATVCFQAQIWNNSGTSIVPTLTIGQATAADTWTGTTVIVNAVALQTCAASTWTQVAYAFTAPGNSGFGLEARIDFGNFFAASTSFVQTVEWDMRVVQAMPTGLTTTPPWPELRPISTEGTFNKRYFWTTYNSDTPPGSAANYGCTGIGVSANQIWSGVQFPSKMRATPTVTLYSSGGTQTRWSTSAGVDTASATANLIFDQGFVLVNSTGITTGNPYFGHVVASSEL